MKGRGRCETRVHKLASPEANVTALDNQILANLLISSSVFHLLVHNLRAELLEK